MGHTWSNDDSTDGADATIAMPRSSSSVPAVVCPSSPTSSAMNSISHSSWRISGMEPMSAMEELLEYYIPCCDSLSSHPHRFRSSAASRFDPRLLRFITMADYTAQLSLFDAVLVDSDDYTCCVCLAGTERRATNAEWRLQIAAKEASKRFAPLRWSIEGKRRTDRKKHQRLECWKLSIALPIEMKGGSPKRRISSPRRQPQPMIFQFNSPGSRPSSPSSRDKSTSVTGSNSAFTFNSATTEEQQSSTLPNATKTEEMQIRTRASARISSSVPSVSEAANIIHVSTSFA